MKEFIRYLTTSQIHRHLNFLELANIKSAKRLDNWKMAEDDQPIFRYIYRNLKPKRYLEFGTWQGAGLLYCLEECDATVWTINKPFGEINNGKKAYGLYPEEVDSAKKWAEKIGYEIKNGYATDSLGFIGRFYLQKDLGGRVCQIYCDSLKWDTSNYPEGFFDIVLIDGGHQKEIVVNDTLKALPLLRKGGIMMWHDYCPPVYKQFECVKGVMDGVESIEYELKKQFDNLFWINPSWILLGVKK